MTQVVKSLVQCNKCSTAGFPNQMIGFLKTDKRKPDGKVFWDLINADGSIHVHKTTVVLPDIEEPQSQPQPQPALPKKLPDISITKEDFESLTYAINSLVLATLSTTEAERNIVKARLARFE